MIPTVMQKMKDGYVYEKATVLHQNIFLLKEMKLLAGIDIYDLTFQFPTGDYLD